MANITYTKLRNGNWGVRSTVEIKDGQTITVTKKDGSTKSETVEKVVWSGKGVWLAALVPSERPSRPAARSYGRRPYGGSRYSTGAGQAANVPGYSSWCTGRLGCGCYDCQ